MDTGEASSVQEGDGGVEESSENDERMECECDCDNVPGHSKRLETRRGRNRCSEVLTSFNESGNIHQLEYANTCASNAEPSVGIVAKNGVVIVTEKKLGSRLIESNTVFTMAKISESIGMVYCGIEADFRQVTTKATKIATSYLVSRDQAIPVNVLLKDLGDNLQVFTQSTRVRPFGLALLIAGWHRNRAHLYKMNCVGSFQPVRAVAIGRNAEVCNAYLERHNTDAIELDAAIILAFQTLKLATVNNLICSHQMAVGFSDQNGFKRMTDDEVEPILEHLRFESLS
ncbi:hypothetical protein ACLKA6_007268 [Drosophila palustris]